MKTKFASNLVNGAPSRNRCYHSFPIYIHSVQSLRNRFERADQSIRVDMDK